MWHIYIYTREYYSVTRKEDILPFATSMDLEHIMLSEIGQRKTSTV